MANERTPAEIQRDIEQARVDLASSLDKLAEQTSPKRLANQAKQTLIERATSPQGKKVIGESVGAIVSILALSRIRTARAKNPERIKAKRIKKAERIDAKRIKKANK